MSNRTEHHEARKATPCENIPNTRILIVDDDDVIRGLFEAVLSHAGYGTESVTNGEEALDMLATAEFDLVLTDRNMPVLDGVGLVRTLRAAGSRIPVMMVSGSLANGGVLPEDIRNEIAVALPKPATASELLAGIVRARNWLPVSHALSNRRIITRLE